MSAKMKRRTRQARLKRIRTERRHHREDQLFFESGRFPASAVSFAVCSCGSRAFSRRAHDAMTEDFYADHAYCDDEVYA